MYFCSTQAAACIESIDAEFARMEARATGRPAVRSSVRLVDYRLPSGEVVGVHHDEGDNEAPFIGFTLAGGAIVTALREDMELAREARHAALMADLAEEDARLDAAQREKGERLLVRSRQASEAAGLGSLSLAEHARRVCQRSYLFSRCIVDAAARLLGVSAPAAARGGR